MNQTVYSNQIFNALQAQISKMDSVTALIYDWKNRKITGPELIKGVEIVTKDLLDSGLKKGDKVIFLVPPSIEAVVYFFALLKVGAVVVLVDPEMGDENFISRIKYSEANYILQDKILEAIERYSFIKPILKFFKIWAHTTLPIKNKITIKNIRSILDQNSSCSFNEVMIDKNENMVIIFTSGTVAQPKGVIHSYSSLSNALRIITNEIAISKSDFLYASQFYFLLIGLTVGAQVYIPKNQAFSPKRFLKITQRYSITSAFLLPFEGEQIYKLCLKTKNKLPVSFKTILFGSAPATKGFLQRFSTICHDLLKVFVVYGSTEMLPISMVDMYEKINYQKDGDLLGKPLTGVTVKIALDKEILTTGPQLFVKYLGDTENANFFNSGDLGGIDSDGNIVLFGRKKDMIIRRGYNIYPTLFESIISKIPGVGECSMVGVYDSKIEDEKVILFITPNGGADVSKEIIKEHLFLGQFSIDSYASPDELIFINDMPRFGRSRKIDKKKLQEISREKLCIE